MTNTRKIPAPHPQGRQGLMAPIDVTQDRTLATVPRACKISLPHPPSRARLTTTPKEHTMTPTRKIRRISRRAGRL